MDRHAQQEVLLDRDVQQGCHVRQEVLDRHVRQEVLDRHLQQGCRDERAHCRDCGEGEPQTGAAGISHNSYGKD